MDVGQTGFLFKVAAVTGADTIVASEVGTAGLTVITFKTGVAFDRADQTGIVAGVEALTVAGFTQIAEIGACFIGVS